MRVWDFPPKYLCDKHLLAQHSEIHAIYSIIENRRSGFVNHPEVSRWRGKLKYLRDKHDETSNEMLARNFVHRSKFPVTLSTTMSIKLSPYLSIKIIPSPESWQSIPEQLALLKAKSETIPGCTCYKRLKEAGY